MYAILLILKFILAICIVLAILFLCIIAKAKLFPSDSQAYSEVKKLKKKPVIKMLNREGDVREDEWHTYIAGVRHHVSKFDIGGFTGWVEADTDNKHDPNAMGIYNSFGKLLGFIPARELEDYRAWCDAKPQPCVGFTFLEDGQLRGRVKILHPCNEEFMQTEFTRYLEWVKDNYGQEYLPKTMSMQFETE